MYWNRRRKWLRAVYWCALAVSGLLLAASLLTLDVPTDIRTLLLVGWGTAAVAADIGLNVLWDRELDRAVEELLPVLDWEPGRFIDGLTALLEDDTSPAQKGRLCIYLSGAYCETGDYQTAKDVLLSIPFRVLELPDRPAYWATLAYARFRLEETGEALNILAQQEQSFRALRKFPELDGLLAELSGYEAQARGERGKGVGLVGICV